VENGDDPTEGTREGKGGRGSGRGRDLAERGGNVEQRAAAGLRP